jgi:hypothetical protein
MLAERFKNELDANGNIMAIGSTITVTLHPANDTLSISNGMLLCEPQAIKKHIDLSR